MRDAPYDRNWRDNSAKENLIAAQSELVDPVNDTPTYTPAGKTFQTNYATTGEVTTQPLQPKSP